MSNKTTTIRLKPKAERLLREASEKSGYSMTLIMNILIIDNIEAYNWIELRDEE